VNTTETTSDPDERTVIHTGDDASPPPPSAPSAPAPAAAAAVVDDDEDDPDERTIIFADDLEIISAPPELVKGKQAPVPAPAPAASLALGKKAAPPPPPANNKSGGPPPGKQQTTTAKATQSGKSVPEPKASTGGGGSKTGGAFTTPPTGGRSTGGSGVNSGGAASTNQTGTFVAAGTRPEPGMYINQYEIIRLLGEGGMGAVYLARDTRLGRRVAIKVLSSTDPEVTKRFIIEARATARVEHENIVSIYEVGEWAASPFMVLQFLQGQELTKLIPKGKPMPVPRVVEIMMPVLRALSYAHGEGIVHRDLKPDNIFVTDAGVTKVLDFGIAKVVQGDDRTSDGEGKVSAAELAAMGDKNVTRHGAVMGTMPYMSPEQWGNGVAIDHTSDIWAVGIMMFRMLSGRHPLHPLSGHELMVTGFLDEAMPSLAEKAPELPKEVVEVVDRCLKKQKSERWADAASLLRALEPLQRGRFEVGKKANIEESPYAGLSSFQEEDASRFFGRNREVAAMSQRLRERPMMAVVGPSGVGKSSFLRAGVVPALKNSGENWEISVIRPGRTPLMALAGLLGKVVETSTKIEDEIAQQHKTAERLAKEPGYLGTALRKQARRDKKNLLLFVDQFEELYTLVPNQQERLAFTACLAAAADDATSPMRVVVSIRSDFLDRCTEDAQFMNEMSQGLFFMTAPTRDGMRDALVQPAEMAGYKFESDAIVNEMLDHLASTSGALPLLQFTADKLWGERDPSRKMLTERSYRALGGIGGALASHADRVLEPLTNEQRGQVRSLFLRLVTPERTRAIVSMDELREIGKGGDVQAVIDLLVQARLLVVQQGGGGTGATVEIVHESLVHGWPQLTKWLDEGQEDSVFLEQMRQAARQWAAKGEDAGLLWRGEMVEEARRFTKRFRGDLPEVQAKFLKAVVDQATRAARRARVLKLVGFVVAAGIFVATAVALVVINESRAETAKQAKVAMASEAKATEAAKEAESRKVEAEKAQKAAESALAEVTKAESAKEEARKAEKEALAKAEQSAAQLKVAFEEAQVAKSRAEQLAVEAQAAKSVAEQRAVEANAAKTAAEQAKAEVQKGAERLKTALEESDRLKRKAEQEKAEAIRRLNEITKGGVVEVLR
jgi:serine/threonine protein kinase